MIKFTRSDLNTELKLEKLLLEITRKLETTQRQSSLQIAILESRLTDLDRSQSTLAQNISAVDGAFSEALRTSPSGTAVYDEQNNVWITTTDGSPSQEGLMTTDSQSFAGDKTFQDDVIVGGDLTVNGDIKLDEQWRFNYSDSHLNVEYYDGAAWGIKGTFIP